MYEGDPANDGPSVEPAGRQARLVDAIVAAERAKALATLEQAQAVAALHGELVDELASDLSGTQMEVFEATGRATAACLSLALGVSGAAADRMLAFALGLAQLPALGEALADGRVDAAQAHLIQREVRVLPVEQRRAVADRLLEDPHGPGRESLARELRDGVVRVWSIPPHKLRPILDREIARLAPVAVVQRETASRRERRVEHYASGPDRSGALVLHGPDHLLTAAYDALDRTARAARRAGAAETLDQLRFDTAVGSMAGAPGPGSAGRIGVSVDVVVPATMLLGRDEVEAGPAVLRTPSGDVPISPALARELAHSEHATWRRILCDPATGVATDVSPRYQPPGRMAEFCRVRDGGTSRFPTSGARVVDLDHVVEYDHEEPGRGGQTTPGNLAALGRREHLAKTARLVEVEGDANGVLTYRTRVGHRYPSLPHRYLDAPGPGPPR
ncbi:MAG: hypothetical protein ACJ71T_00570 [Actinomycetales bacterium]